MTYTALVLSFIADVNGIRGKGTNLPYNSSKTFRSVFYTVLVFVTVAYAGSNFVIKQESFRRFTENHARQYQSF